MKIGLLAAKTGLSIQTIRFYERKSLLAAPERTASNYRSYSEDALKQLHVPAHSDHPFRFNPITD
ncbi:MAG: MerR family DNA-binding transcriptional regulator, partial [Paraglaciecola chathamensis]